MRLRVWRALGGSLRLWVKLAAFAVLGVVAMHAVHLVIGNRVATRALARDQAQLGSGIARLIAADAADPFLLHDTVTLTEIVSRAVAIPGVAYCFVVEDGHAIASSFTGGPPEALVSARDGADEGPLVLVTPEARYLDLQAPILGGSAVVRLGIDMAILQSARREIAFPLGLVALAVAIAGVVAALIVGRRIARPLEEIVEATDRFDPAGAPTPIRPHGGPEVATLGARFNRMMDRLRAAHEEQERARSKALTTERLAALGSLTAGVAHEVNNPLAGLKNCVRALRLPDTSDETKAEYLDLMDDGLDRIRDVVQRLLEFGRPRPLALAPVAARELAAESGRLVTAALRRRRIELAVDAGGPAGDAVVLADRGQIGQVMLNLLLNAAYVTPDGGRLDVVVRRRSDGMVGLAVVDKGPGIPDAVRQRMFDPFFSTKPEGEGTGLGLSVSQTIVASHAGELEFICPAEGGTVATLWLPGASRAAGASAA